MVCYRVVSWARGSWSSATSHIYYSGKPDVVKTLIKLFVLNC